MCGSRKTSATVMSTSIRHIFTKIAPSSASGCAVFAFILVSIVLLGVTLLPQIFIYETDFTGLIQNNNGLVSINGNQGVTNISWGTWLACYANATDTTCTQRDWINNPYNFTIEYNGAQAAVQQLWPRVLFLQLIGVIFAVLIVFVLLARVWCLNMQSGRTSYVEPGRRACNTANLLTASLWVWITIVVILNVVVLYSINKEMLSSLGTGITTTPALGFWMPAAADVFILVTVVLVFSLIKYKVEKSTEVKMELATTSSS